MELVRDLEALQAERQEVIDRINELDIDFSIVDQFAAPDDPMYPNGSDSIPLNKLRLDVFRSRLIKHFAISKMLGEITWG